MKKKPTPVERAAADVDQLQQLLAEFDIGAHRDADGRLLIESGREVFIAAHETPSKAARRIKSEHDTADIADLARVLGREVPGVTVERAGSEMLFRIDGGVVAGLSSTRVRLEAGGAIERTDDNLTDAREFLREGLRTVAFARPTRHIRAVRAQQHSEHVYLKLPNGLPRSVRDAAMSSGARLRTSRSIDPALAVEIATEIGTLRFDPVELRNPLEARFRLERGPDYFIGGLRLKTPGDPLAIRVHDYGSGRLFADAWAGALVVYAHLTCVAGEAAPVLDEPDARVRGRPAVTGKSSSVDTRPRLAGRQTPPADETTSYATIAEARSALQAVSGHIRHLAQGREPGREAVLAAELLGIRLPDGSTWVRAHNRGLGVVRLSRGAVPHLW